MAFLYPDLAKINKLKVPATDGEIHLCETLTKSLSDDFHIFFNPYLDGDRPDIIVLKKNCGALIVEIKDWNLSSYRIDKNNRWSVQSSFIKSPFAQAFRYKSNFYDLHLPTLGLKEALNKAFFKVINCFVYFHLGTKESIKEKYHSALVQINDEINDNNEKFRNKQMPYDTYEKRRIYLQNKKSQIGRDQNLAITKDNTDILIKKLNSLAPNKLFNEEIFDEFYRRLKPPEQVLEQGIKLKYDKKQTELIESVSEFKKVKGVAGCGKTTVIAQRAVNAFKRHEEPVLVLTFNITLKHYIKDKISDVREGIEFNNFEITNYHQFFNSQINNLNIDTQEFLDNQTEKGLSFEQAFNLLFKTDLFQTLNVYKYHTIFIDEIQDYESEWVKIIRDNFLKENGEMVIFGDQSQNIYEREINKRESSIVQGFGRWLKLTKSYRSGIDSPLINLFKEFQKKFLLEKYSDSEIFDSEYNQGTMNFDILQYESYSNNDGLKSLYSEIIKNIKAHSWVPNDITIVCSNIEVLRKVNSFFNNNEKTMVMFESSEEYFEILKCSALTPRKELLEKEGLNKNDLEKMRRRKKNFFMQNSGLVKLSTIHSFKGLESPTVFCVLLEKDNPEIIYTALTRAKKNLVIFDVENSKYSEFFKNMIV